MTIDEQIGIRLNEFRVETGISQIALSELVGVQQGFLNQVIKGHKGISAKILINITARILKRLHDSGALPGDIAGLTWYSWKDTGISLHAAKTSPLSTRDQAGHIDFSVTSIYYHAPEQNQEYRVLENDLLM